MCVNVVVGYADGGGIARTLCLIMINLAIQAGGPLSRTGLPVETKRGPGGILVITRTREERKGHRNSRNETRIMVDSW